MKKLSNYIKTNALQKIGCGFNDILIERIKLKDFIETVYQYGYVVTEITWWKHRLISDQTDDYENMGGIVDSHNKNYYWAETIYYQTFDDKNNSKLIVLDYYSDCCCDNKYENLTPAISIGKL